MILIFLILKFNFIFEIYNRATKLYFLKKFKNIKKSKIIKNLDSKLKF